MTKHEADIVLEKLRKLLEEIPNGVPEKREIIREEVKKLSALLDGVRRLAKLKLVRLTQAKAARDRILAYLKLFVGVPVDAEELQVVGGIQEFARRIRELRVQSGYKISTGYSADDLRPDQYRLESSAPDKGEARLWKTVNGIRKLKISGRDRILALLKAFVGKPVTVEQIAYVADIKEAARRVRELRTEMGWRIVTKQTGRPDLPTGAYILESLDQLPEHDRKIPDAVYDGVLERDGYKCRSCGWAVKDRNPMEKRQFLEVHHIVHHAQRGPNNPENLVTLCNVHHDEVHRAGIGGVEFFNWLKNFSK